MYIYIHTIYIYLLIQFYTMEQKKDAPSGLMAILIGGFNPPENNIYIYIFVKWDHHRQEETNIYIYNIIENTHTYIYIIYILISMYIYIYV